MAKCCYVINILLYITLSILSFLCIGLGIWLLLQENWSFVIFGLYSIQILGGLLIASGILIFITTIFGIFGLKCQNPVCALLYVGIIGICCILIIVAASLLFTYQKKVHNFLGDHVKSVFIDKYGFDSSYTAGWDEVQASYKCCGVVNRGDYKSTKWYNQTANDRPLHPNVPLTCCTHYSNGSYINENECLKANPEDKSVFVFNDGCLDKMKEKIVTMTFGTAIAMFTVSGFLLIVLVSGCVMLRQISRGVSYGQVV